MLEGIGSQFVPVSAVCCMESTLYMFSKVDSGRRQLVFCGRAIKGGSPIFLNIGNQEPVALFGLYKNAAAINSEGEIIFIDRESVKNSPDSHISSFSLPDGEKASSVACCGDTIVALSRNCRVFTSKIENGLLNFSKSDSLSSEEIKNISGTSNYCLAVSKTGRVFGLGSNKCGQLGLSKETLKFSSFTELSSLSKYEITAAFAGFYHSFFVTCEGKILSCGQNGRSQLLLNNSNSKEVYSPTETAITDNSPFFILGNMLTVSFIDGNPPPNTPNMKIQYH